MSSTTNQNGVLKEYQATKDSTVRGNDSAMGTKQINSITQPFIKTESTFLLEKKNVRHSPRQFPPVNIYTRPLFLNSVMGSMFWNFR